MIPEYEEKVLERIKEGSNITEICREFGLARSYPYALAKKYGLKLAKKTSHTTVNSLPITKLHAVLGSKLAWERIYRRNKEKKFAAADIGITPTKLGMIEKGTHDISLSELIKLADYYEVSPWMILKSACESQFDTNSAFKI